MRIATLKKKKKKQNPPMTDPHIFERSFFKVFLQPKLILFKQMIYL